ncbi:MAG: hypothetical protein HGB35_04355, partial [Geobacteraceae bacterium]|nr:hypothetical protein [Geobacteraceae bacterium]
MSNFLLGVLSSLAASFLYVVLTRTSLRWWRSYPRGIRFVEPERDQYIHKIGELIRSNRNSLFFKGFTGFDLFSSDIIKSAL